MKAFSDVHLLQREYYNPNKFRVYFTRMVEKDAYVLATGKALGPMTAVCMPDSHLYLPHGYYEIKGHGLEQNEPIKMLLNLEKSMFKGNKIPSNSYGLGE